ncbi:hypothetical protein [Streptomyces sp. NPDC004284]|uniref:hypothetical protein n=1 Tax=Streptomyces sp. NPDC004284 TaxID=3364695 RepID=UPI003683BF72
MSSGTICCTRRGDVTWADYRFAFRNCLTPAEDGTDAEQLERHLHRAAEIMRSKERPGFLWLFEGLLYEGARDELEAAAERAGASTSFPARPDLRVLHG